MFELDAELALQTLQSVARGLRFLHEARPPLLHADLKSPNVLLDRAFAAKLSDIAFPAARRPAAPHGTLAWMAPECLRGRPNTPAADVYSFGVVAHECLAGRPPYMRDTAREQLAAVEAAGASPPLPPGCSPEMAALLRECLHPDPDRRPPAAEIDRRLAGWGPASVARLAGSAVCPRQSEIAAAGASGRKVRALSAREAISCPPASRRPPCSFTFE